MLSPPAWDTGLNTAWLSHQPTYDKQVMRTAWY
ncbi:hypothetical protein DFAR_2030006 [Desulfarculales bacterium]